MSHDLDEIVQRISMGIQRLREEWRRVLSGYCESCGRPLTQRDIRKGRRRCKQCRKADGLRRRQR